MGQHRRMRQGRKTRGGGEAELASTIGRGARATLDLLNRLDHDAAIPDAGQRIYARRRYRAMGVPVLLHHPGGSSVEVPLVCRNLSRSGIALLHAAYVHVGTKCRVVLPLLTGREQKIPGEVVRCVHREGRVHEVGVAFEQPVDVRRFVEIDPLSSWFTMEHVDPSSLCGTLLHFDADDASRRVARTLLKETDVSVRTAETGEEGLDIAPSRPPNVVLIASGLPDMSIPDVLDRLRACEVAPAVLLTGDEIDAEMRTAAARREVVGFIPKPFEKHKLLQGLAEAMREGPEQVLLDGAVGDDTLEAFQSQLGDIARLLDDALARGENMPAYAACTRLSEAASALGYVDISRLADRVSGGLSRGTGFAPIRQHLEDLIGLCRAFAPLED